MRIGRVHQQEGSAHGNIRRTNRLGITDLGPTRLASGIDFLIASTGIQVHPDPMVRAEFMRASGIQDIFYPDRRIERLTTSLGIPSILLAPRFQEIAERDKIFIHGFPNTRMGTGHWNEAGHRLAAEILAGELCGTALSKTLQGAARP